MLRSKKKFKSEMDMSPNLFELGSLRRTTASEQWISPPDAPPLDSLLTTNSNSVSISHRRFPKTQSAILTNRQFEFHGKFHRIEGLPNPSSGPLLPPLRCLSHMQCSCIITDDEAIIETVESLNSHQPCMWSQSGDVYLGLARQNSNSPNEGSNHGH